MFVVHGPIAIERAAAQCVGRALPEQRKPVAVGARGGKVKAFVTHEAERAGRRQEQRQVADEKCRREQRIRALLQPRRETAHRASSAKQTSPALRSKRRTRTSTRPPAP